MSAYTITTTHGSRVVEADDFTTSDTQMFFRDDIGRALLVVTITDDLIIEGHYDNDDNPHVIARRALVAAQRAANLIAIQNETEKMGVG